MGIFDERALFERGPVVLFCWRAVDGCPVEHVSRNTKDVLGHSPDDFVSGAVAYAALIHEDDIGRVGGEVAAGAASGAPAFEHLPYRLRHKDGRVLWIYDFTHVVRDAEGHVTHFVGYVFDITARVEGENERLRLERLVQESRTEAFATATPDVFVTIDEAATITYVSPAARTVLGYEPEALVGAPLTKIVPPRLRVAHERGLGRFLASGERTRDWAHLAFSALHADGHEVDIEAAFGQYQASGARYLTAVLRDVSLRKKEADLLLRTLELKRAVVDGSPSAILTCDDSGRITLANARACEMYDTSAAELVDASFYAVAIRGDADPLRIAAHAPLDDKGFVVTSEDVTAVRAASHALAREEGVQEHPSDLQRSCRFIVRDGLVLAHRRAAGASRAWSSERIARRVRCSAGCSGSSAPRRAAGDNPAGGALDRRSGAPRA